MRARSERQGARSQKMPKTFGLMLFFLLASGSSLLASGKAGTSGAAFLKIGTGARATALGEAVTAVVDDVNAVSWNPAGLAGVTTPQFTAVQTQWLQEYD